MERLRRIRSKSLMLASAILAVCLVIVQALAWHWWHEKEIAQALYDRSQQYSAALGKEKKMRPWLSETAPDPVEVVQNCAAQAHVQILSYDGRQGSSGSYTIVLEGTFSSLFSCISDIERHIPHVIIHGMTLERAPEAPEILRCHIKI